MFNLKAYIMKRVLILRALLAVTALLISITLCFGQEDPSDLMAGTWTKPMGERAIKFTLKADHTYQVDFAGDDGIDVYGRFEISGSQITFNDEGGDYSADVPGSYNFEVDDITLKLSVADDPVNGRSMLMTGNWKRAGDD